MNWLRELFCFHQWKELKRYSYNYRTIDNISGASMDKRPQTKFLQCCSKCNKFKVSTLEGYWEEDDS